MHIGNRIEQISREKRYGVSWFASQICCTRTHVYKIFAMRSIDTEQLMRISAALDHDFFLDLSLEYHSRFLPSDMA
ncbi:MAG: XRE family transcriptional regulator [Bacteroidales bacterium]|nr:XRE family transcriptional regulator [Bacteroidales bacterium]